MILQLRNQPLIHRYVETQEKERLVSGQKRGSNGNSMSSGSTDPVWSMSSKSTRHSDSFCLRRTTYGTSSTVTKPRSETRNSCEILPQWPMRTRTLSSRRGGHTSYLSKVTRGPDGVGCRTNFIQLLSLPFPWVNYKTKNS